MKGKINEEDFVFIEEEVEEQPVVKITLTEELLMDEINHLIGELNIQYKDYTRERRLSLLEYFDRNYWYDIIRNFMV